MGAWISKACAEWSISFIGAGIDGVTALGVTGEVARLTESERMQVLETVISQVRGRVRVIAGTSADGLRTCIGYSRSARDAGADAVMISPPRMVKLNSDAVRGHYAEVVSAADVDIVVQDYPPISGFAMEPELLARISRENPRARTIKLEDPPTPFKTAQILERAQGTAINISRRTRWRLPARRTDRGRSRRHDRVCVSAYPG